MKKQQSAHEDSAEKANDRPISSNGTSTPVPSKKTENGGHQRNRSGKMILENMNLPSLTGNGQNTDKPKPQILELVINKDKYGYGMKVSGENPVFVDSVKEGGAANRAGLHAADMILRVNGHNVRYSTHAEVVQLMKATQNVELTVQRNARNFALPIGGGGSGPVTPSTPTSASQRNSITAPLPVDHQKRMEVEFTKMHTLYLMLEQEKKNLEKLKENESQNANEIGRAEANIRTLQDQLKQSTGDVSSSPLMNIMSSSTKVTASPPTPTSTPTFLARFPRSLSQLNLGNKRKSTTVASPQEPTRPLPSSPQTPSSSSSSNTPISSPSHQQKVKVRHQHPVVTADVPPPLPQRNIQRKPTTPTTAQVSDLDSSLMAAKAQVPVANKKKNKQKAYSDPKMSSEMMMQMEASNYPPPLPPRQIGCNNFGVDDGSAFGQVITNKDSTDNSPTALDGRPFPNSCATQMHYPLISTSVAVRDGIPPHGHFPAFESSLMNISSSSLPPELPAVVKPKKHHRNASNPDLSPPICGTPPPAYDGPTTQITAAQTNIEQRGILAFECDDETDEEPMDEDDGIFRSISMLTAPENSAYLIVFLNFVLSNSKPSAILFYLITDLYKKGNVKDMRKWAYEIHSTFLVPTAPLSFLPDTDNMCETIARDVDDKLAHAKNYQPTERNSGAQDFEMVGLLRTVFQKARSRARDMVNRQMEEFQEKRTAGLGTMFGPSAQDLAAARKSKIIEQKIVEDFLMPKLQVMLDETENAPENDEKMALASALSTVVYKIFLPRGPAAPNSERVNHYVTREKSFKSRLMSKNRKSVIRGHHLILRQYYETTHCNHCGNLIWGVAPQGYACGDCGLNVHRCCSKLLEETCPGPVHVSVDRFTKLMDRIREKGHGMQNASKKQEEDTLGWDDALPSDRSASFSARPRGDTQFQRLTHTSNSTSQLPSQDISQPDFAAGSSSTITSSAGGSSTGIATTVTGSPQTHMSMEGIGDHTSTPTEGKRGKQKSSQPNARSESYKECSPKRSRTNRPKSDPSLYEDDVASPLDHPEDSMNSSSVTITPNKPMPGTSLDTSSSSSEDESFSRDLETTWSTNVTQEIIQQLTDAEKKRQEIINELFETEKSHVKILKVLQNVFKEPLEQSKAMTSELIQLVFPPSLSILKDWHLAFEAALKQTWKEHNCLVKEIGDCLNVFDGTSGEILKEHAARFCARQQIALEVLKERRKKDENLQRGLIKAESHKACRRLQLKDLLPAVLQRLTKYPLLFERLQKCTDGADAEAIKRALDASKAILDYVNQAVRIAEELRSIQKKLDKSSYEKEAPNEFKNLDLTNYKLIHDGFLTIKKGTIQLRVLLFENMIVLLQKQDDKYLMKSFANPTGIGDNVMVSPITKICNTIVRLNAVDNRAFFLINQSDQNSQMLELTAPTQHESEIWIRKITEAAEKANHLKKVQSKPLPAIPVPPPPPALEETPENLLNSPPDETEKQPETTEQEPKVENEENKEPEEEPEPEDDPNAIQTTQPCQLIQPTEINIAAQNVQEASRIVTPEESLRRHGDVIQKSVVEMEKIICDINRVPQEHFAEIADIAAQPEAQSDLAELALAAFAQTKFLVECVNSSLINGTVGAPIASLGGAALCDNCVRKDLFAIRNGSTENLNAIEPATMDTDIVKDSENETDGDNLYCEIEPLKNETAIATKVSHMEINDTYSSAVDSEIRKSAIIKIDKIAASVTTLNSLVSQLSIKIAERDHEREMYRRENQRLRQQLQIEQENEIVENAVNDLEINVIDLCDKPPIEPEQ
ncbi:rho guanine nucleotide exchange factor 12-like isoform X1 [Chironomus tepperi]|uniref:rho guanine nucleotide exchange factor 12-like isoform X1 n=1 Tax=Chironomus tepperi TaxID=113505 RepID=UPI00391F5EEE